MQQDENFSEILEWLNKVYKGEADHDTFVKAARGDKKLQADVFNFILIVFRIQAGDIQTTKVLDYLLAASVDLNLQFMIYSNTCQTHCIKKNRFMYPIVINIFTPEASDSFYMLYHENYKIISPENLNTSEEFAESQEEVPLCPTKRLIKRLVHELSSLEQLDQEDKDQLLAYINDLKQIDYLGYESEKLLGHLLN